MELALHSLAYPVTALGPGRRVALWVAGCPLRCPGCITPELLEGDSGRLVSIEDLATRILSLDCDLSGLTLSGGEPFAQPGGLSNLLDRVRRARPTWNVIAYSGFRLDRLRGMGEDVAELLARVDVLVDGPYLADRPSGHALAGSGNQEVHFLTPVGRSMRSAVEALPWQSANLAVGDGVSMLVGIIGPARRRAYHHALGVGIAGQPSGTADGFVPTGGSAAPRRVEIDARKAGQNGEGREAQRES